MDLRDRLHASRRRAQAENRDWDVADVMAELDAEVRDDAPVSSPAGEDVERVARAHTKTWESTGDEAWGRPGICEEDRQPWPCDTAVVLAALSARPVEAQEVEHQHSGPWLREGIDGRFYCQECNPARSEAQEVVAGRAVAMLAVKMQAERDAALARAEAAEAWKANAEITLDEDERYMSAQHDELVRLRAVVEAVRGLHRPHSYPSPDHSTAIITYCVGCDESDGGHPCNTLAALSAQPVAQEGEDPLRVEVRRLLTEFDDYDKRREITLGYIESRLRPLVPVETGGEGR